MTSVLLGDIPERNAGRYGPARWAVRHGEHVLSWGELAENARRRAHALAAQGIGEGDRVVLSLPNGNAFFELTFAIWKLGATPTVVSPRLPLYELKGIVELAEPKAIIADDTALYEALSAWPVTFGSDHPDSAPFASREAACWKVMTSGGSTGRPKLIVDHHAANMDEANPGMGIPEGGVMLNPAPLYHNFPFTMTIMNMLQGNSVAGMIKFDATECLRLIERCGVQWLLIVPTMMNRISRLPEEVRASFDVSSLETVWHTSAPIAPWLKLDWIEWLGPEKIWEMYGGTEGVAATVLNGKEWLEHRGSVGRAMRGEVVVRAEDGRQLPIGEVGEIFMRGSGGEEAQENYHYVGAESRRQADGFDSLGDFGWMDKDGYLYIADRRTDLILSGGRNIYPAEIEAVLTEHPAVAEAIAIGLPDPDLGACPHALVRLEIGQTITDAELLDFARERLIAYKLPRTIEFTETPLRDEAGKTRRSRLREERLAALATPKASRLIPTNQTRPRLR